MGRPIGIEHHYPPLSKFERWYLLGVPAGIAAFSMMRLQLVPYIGLWIGVIAGCFALGWLGIVAEHALKAIERFGYRAAIEDIRWLCIGEADFVKGPNPPEPKNLLAAAIVTLEAKSPL